MRHRSILPIICLLPTLCLLPASYAKNTLHLITSTRQHNYSPTNVLQLLKQGNSRYRQGATVSYNQRSLSRLASKKGQAPYAFIFSCVDSRSVPEVVFNQPVGSLFVSRIAGNVISNDVLGSMEFATGFAGTKLVVIMGHTQCGAVAGACAGVDKPPALGSLLSKIKPAAQEVARTQPISCENGQTIDEIARQNVLDQMKALEKTSPALKKSIQAHRILLVGAMHNIKTGQVQFFDGTGKAL